MKKIRALRNRTLTLSPVEKKHYGKTLIHILKPTELATIRNRIANQDIFEILNLLPACFVDLLVLDPPYNLDKTFISTTFKKKTMTDYAQWFETWFAKLLPTLKHTAGVYVCCEWNTSTAVHLVLEKYLKVRNRITWEREKGRGAKANWKNAAEDIWFATVSDDYVFNVDAVKLKRKVIAPYRRQRPTKGLARNFTRPFPFDPSLEPLDRHNRPLLVDAGKHRPPNPKKRKTYG